MSQLGEPSAQDPSLPASERWIVAIGASAGGLEALQRFFSAVTAPTSAAFVVIQHLSPDHRSMMPELLARHTALPVQEAVAGAELEVDRVYLMPPGVLMTIADEHLVFTPRPLHGLSLPIDEFFRSLSVTLAERSIGVVLSGSGSDGSAGASVLRAAGGYVMAQQPETAKFDSMPRSVAAATAVDAVAPPEGLAQHVVSLTRGHTARSVVGGLLASQVVKPALQRLFETLLEHGGIDFSQYKLPTVMRRIERRMAVQACASVSDYADQVAGSLDEREFLRRELLIPVTSFFRDGPSFEALGTLLRHVIARQPPNLPLRIWCAGCATGEEAYSLAMLAQEACHQAQRWPGVKVFATDVDPRFLAIGSTGSYPAGAADAMSAERLAQFFIRQDDRLVVKPELRQMVLFARHNLLEDAPFTKMDLVVCRNTLIYFQGEAQERVMRRLQYALLPGALLFLGSSESLGALQADFQVVDSACKIFRLVRPVLTALAVREGFGRSVTTLRNRSADRQADLVAAPSTVDAGLRDLVQAYLPLSMLVTSQRQLVHAWGPTERYLRLPQGQPNLDVIRLLPERLGAVASHALHGAMRDRLVHRQPPVEVTLEGKALLVQVVARPVKADDVAEPCVLISFEELQPGLAGSIEPPLDASQIDRLALLERELSESRLTLQTSIEELEAANEELQATNEELMSSNEELQSTNEELQSVNEELYTVNAEYNAKLDQVNALNADLDGMSRATGIGTVFVDQSLALVRFTPEAALLFRLRGHDTGRPITDFNPLLDYPQLVDDLRHALQHDEPIERRVDGQADAVYLARVVGYGGLAAGTRRAVLSLIDVSQMRDAERLQLLIDSLPEHMALLDPDGNITQVNHAWAQFSQRNGGDNGPRTGVGANYLAVLARSSTAEAPAILRGVQQVLSGQRDRFSQTYPCHGPAEQRWFELRVSRQVGPAPDERGGAIVTHLDVTAYQAAGTVTPALLS